MRRDRRGPRGVKKRSSAHVAARPGARRPRTANAARIGESVVAMTSLLCPGPGFHARFIEEALEGAARALQGAPVPEQPDGVMVGEHDPVELVGELLRVE